MQNFYFEVDKQPPPSPTPARKMNRRIFSTETLKFHKIKKPISIFFVIKEWNFCNSFDFTM